MPAADTISLKIIAITGFEYLEIWHAGRCPDVTRDALACCIKSDGMCDIAISLRGQYYM